MRPLSARTPPHARNTTTSNYSIAHPKSPSPWAFHSTRTKSRLFLDSKKDTRTQELPIGSARDMEEEKQTNMSKKDANKYMRFLVKEWSTADNEVFSVPLR